ncbi:class I SAM-dependent methyltransferase [Thermomonas sp.]|jgi:SAM-dependent methyltransferase|uniref:class I SAM-dependent methyltransferase n=1 Tax=Thermomonas sp. TaxID=1971895 RepID=UPI00257FC628|nr:class I SAM-dependent methyltransferase [Thermomonas sp.]
MSRLAHAVTDLASRQPKALKIERLLALTPQEQPLQVLEIGTGAGAIAHYFGTHPRLRCAVTAVDVHDNRRIHDGYTYVPVRGVALPFPDSRFDVVISNHVIEHVGAEDAQMEHLSEIRRVMKPGGKGYLAVPNRWMFTEPHYRLKFLSWWPRPLRTPYLRAMRKGERYDCEPLELWQLEGMLSAAGLDYRNLCVEALRETLEIERPGALVTRFFRQVPDGALRPFRWLIPTLIYRVEKNEHDR